MNKKKREKENVEKTKLEYFSVAEYAYTFVKREIAIRCIYVHACKYICYISCSIIISFFAAQRDNGKGIKSK